jgi:hypothetical protein
MRYKFLHEIMNDQQNNTYKNKKTVVLPQMTSLLANVLYQKGPSTRKVVKCLTKYKLTKKNTRRERKISHKRRCAVCREVKHDIFADFVDSMFISVSVFKSNILKNNTSKFAIVHSNTEGI